MVLWGEGPLAIGMRLVVITAAVVEAGFGVLLQLLGQVGSWSTGWDVIFVPILWISTVLRSTWVWKYWQREGIKVGCQSPGHNTQSR